MFSVSVSESIQSRHVLAHLPTVVAGAALLACTFSPPEQGSSMYSSWVQPGYASMWGSSSSPMSGRSGWIVVGLLVLGNLVVSIGGLVLDCVWPRVRPRMLPVMVSSGVVAGILVALVFYLARQTFVIIGPAPPIGDPSFSFAPVSFGHFTHATTLALWIAVASFVYAGVVVIGGRWVHRRAIRVAGAGELAQV
jgi:hypothetical protein